MRIPDKEQFFPGNRIYKEDIYTMTSKERLLAAIRHEEPDIVPNAPRLWAFLLEYYQGTGKGILDAAAEFDYDPIICIGPGLPGADSRVSIETETAQEGDLTAIRRKIKTPAGDMTDGYAVAPRGREYGISPNQHWFEHAVKGREDLDKIRYLFPQLKEISIDRYATTVENVGERGLVEMRPTSGADQYMADYVGNTAAMMMYYDDKELFKELLNLFHKYNQAVMRKCLEAGVEVIFDSWYNVSLSTGWSPQMYREMFLPLMKENVQLVHSYDAIYHFYDDGRCTEVIGDWADCGMDVIATLTPPPVGDVDLALTKKKVGDRVCLKGNIDLLYVIYKGTPELVREKVKEAIEIGAPGGGFILSTSDSIREGTPVENVRAYFEAAREYGVIS